MGSMLLIRKNNIGKRESMLPFQERPLLANLRERPESKIEISFCFCSGQHQQGGIHTRRRVVNIITDLLGVIVVLFVHGMLERFQE